MRYYDITITKPDGSQFAKYTSYVNGKTDLGALDVQWNIPVVSMGLPQTTFMVIIFGVSIQTISQAMNFNGLNIQISGGFQKGLPLANPAQAGILAKANILQAFGNWIGTDMTLNLICIPGFKEQSNSDTNTNTTAMQSSNSSSNIPVPTGTVNMPMNGMFVWKKGTTLTSAIENFISTALGPQGFTSKVNINSSIIAPFDKVAHYPIFRAFSDWVYQYSKSVVNTPNYPGVTMQIVKGNLVNVSDQTTVSRTTQIQFNELIGQPTWISPTAIQFKCPKRSDLSVTDQIIFPKGIFPAIAPAGSLGQGGDWNYRNQSQQQGTFVINQLYHYGRFRQPSADAWVTVVDCIPQSTNNSTTTNNTNTVTA